MFKQIMSFVKKSLDTNFHYKDADGHQTSVAILPSAGVTQTSYFDKSTNQYYDMVKTRQDDGSISITVDIQGSGSLTPLSDFSGGQSSLFFAK